MKTSVLCIASFLMLMLGVKAQIPCSPSSSFPFVDKSLYVERSDKDVLAYDMVLKANGDFLLLSSKEGGSNGTDMVVLDMKADGTINHRVVFGTNGDDIPRRIFYDPNAGTNGEIYVFGTRTTTGTNSHTDVTFHKLIWDSGVSSNNWRVSTTSGDNRFYEIKSGNDDNLRDVIKLAGNAGFIITGRQRGGGNNAGFTNAFIAKVDISGAHQWTQVIGKQNGGNDETIHVVENGSNLYFVGSYYNSSASPAQQDVMVGVIDLTSTTGAITSIAKYSISGDNKSERIHDMDFYNGYLYAIGIHDEKDAIVLKIDASNLSLNATTFMNVASNYLYDYHTSGSQLNIINGEIWTSTRIEKIEKTTLDLVGTDFEIAKLSTSLGIEEQWLYGPNFEHPGFAEYGQKSDFQYDGSNGLYFCASELSSTTNHWRAVVVYKDLRGSYGKCKPYDGILNVSQASYSKYNLSINTCANNCTLTPTNISSPVAGYGFSPATSISCDILSQPTTSWTKSYGREKYTISIPEGPIVDRYEEIRGIDVTQVDDDLFVMLCATQNGITNANALSGSGSLGDYILYGFDRDGKMQFIKAFGYAEHDDVPKKIFTVEYGSEWEVVVVGHTNHNVNSSTQGDYNFFATNIKHDYTQPYSTVIYDLKVNEDDYVQSATMTPSNQILISGTTGTDYLSYQAISTSLTSISNYIIPTGSNPSSSHAIEIGGVIYLVGIDGDLFVKASGSSSKTNIVLSGKTLEINHVFELDDKLGMVGRNITDNDGFILLFDPTTNTIVEDMTLSTKSATTILEQFNTCTVFGNTLLLGVTSENQISGTSFKDMGVIEITYNSSASQKFSSGKIRYLGTEGNEIWENSRVVLNDRYDEYFLCGTTDAYQVLGSTSPNAVNHAYFMRLNYELLKTCDIACIAQNLTDVSCTTSTGTASNSNSTLFETDDMDIITPTKKAEDRCPLNDDDQTGGQKASNENILSEKMNTSELSVYPNPTSSELTIRTNNDIKTILLRSLNGQVLIKTTPRDPKLHVINMSEYPSGVYILEIISTSGVEVRKVIKE